MSRFFATGNKILMQQLLVSVDGGTCAFFVPAENAQKSIFILFWGSIVQNHLNWYGCDLNNCLVLW
jgi:hypothetical protein